MRAGCGFVTFVEEKIQDLEDIVKAGFEVAAGWDFEGQVELSDFLAGAGEAFLDCCFGGQKGVGYFFFAESAEGFQGEGGLALGGEFRVAADEDEAECVVCNVTSEGGVGLGKGGISHALFYELGDVWGFALEGGFAAEGIEGEVFCGSGEPGGWIVWYAIIGPGLEGADECFLSDVFCKLDMGCAEDGYEDGQEVLGFLAEQVLSQMLYLWLSRGVWGGGRHIWSRKGSGLGGKRGVV